MMEIWIELLSNLTQMFILTLFITKAFGFKNDKMKFGFAIIWLVAFFELSFINHIVVYDGFLSGIVILSIIVYARLCLKGDFFQQIFVAIFSMTIIFTIGNVLLFLFSYIFKVSTEILIADSSILRVAILTIGRILEWSIFHFIIRINSKYSLSLKEWFLFTSMPFLTWVAVTLVTQSSLDMHYIQSQMFYMAIIMIAINVIVFFFMYKIKKDTQTEIEYELLKMQYNNIKQMEVNMKALCESTYAVKHDMEKHLLALKALTQNKQFEKIDEYIERIFDRDLNAIQKIVFTDNDVFNAVVNTKLELCRQKRIYPSITISNEAVSHIKISDIAVLFGNIFDNAIEAAENTENKIILLNIQLQGEYVSVYMENSFSEKHSNISLETSKKNPHEHGFGTKNVRKIIEENDGMIQYFQNDSGMFCCDILLKKS